MNARRLLSLLAVAATAAIALAMAASAAAATTGQEESVSSNWSGYVAGGSGSSKRYASVSASWVQPSVSVSSGDSYSVFWVGLGGSNGSSDSLEQVGTEANYVNGKVEYYAWYELVPSGPVKLQLPIRPGDKISASVRVSGTTVRVALLDRTTGQWSENALPMSNPDASSAEWIAEAPSACNGSGSCHPLTLAHFASVKFTDATVTTTSGHIGSIADPNWTTQSVRLDANERRGGGMEPAFASTQLADGADPSSLSSYGSSFLVSYRASTSQTSTIPQAGPTIDGFASPGPGS